MASYKTLQMDQDGELLTVTLNRPKLNLINPEMIEELIQVWHSLRHNTTDRFVILTARGDNFSAGVDLKAVDKKAFTPQEARKGQLAGHELMRSLESVEQVTVAVLKGAVVGAGMAVAMACDFRIMDDSGYFLVPETLVGTYFTWGCTPRLVRMVGASKAMEIIMTSDTVNAAEAYRLGLVNRVVEDGDLTGVVHRFIAKIASKSPTCVRLTKKIALGASMEGFGNMFAVEPELMQVPVYSGETVEGVSAFLEKRFPDYPAPQQKPED